MRFLKIGVVVVCVMAVSACVGSPTSPVTPPVPSCQANNTGTLVVSNTSRGTAQRIVLDGSTVATLGPGSSTSGQTLAAGATYTLEFFVANTNNYACSASLVTVAQCTTTTRSCAFP
jgi:hypothetical protein